MKGSNLPKVSLNIYWRNSVGSTDIYSGKIQSCLCGSCAWTNKNVCRLKQHTVQVSLYMVSYPKKWNCWNSTHSESWAMDLGKCWACCRRRDWIRPEPVWIYHLRGDPVSLFLIRPQLTNMSDTVNRAFWTDVKQKHWSKCHIFHFQTAQQMDCLLALKYCLCIYLYISICWI